MLKYSQKITVKTISLLQMFIAVKPFIQDAQIQFKQFPGDGLSFKF